MEAVKYYSRDIFTLTNEEIIKLVDMILVNYNLDRIAHSLYQERPSLSREINYRKIEAINGLYEFAYVIKVTLGFEDLGRKITTGFVLSNEGAPGDNEIYEGDFYIGSVLGFYQPFEHVVHLNGTGKGFGIDFDYSHLIVYTKRLYQFFNDTLRLWSSNLSPDKYQYNQHLLDLGKENIQEYVIEEVDNINQPERIAAISK
ncbi:MAG: hypothetical protein V4456_11605 [Bacteroidota bacterium]